MLQILKWFDWTWVGLLVSDDDYGLNVARSFQSELALSGGGCLAYLEVLPWGDDPGEFQRIVGIMKKSTSRVVIVFAHENHMLKLLGEVRMQFFVDIKMYFALPTTISNYSMIIIVKIY